MSGNRKTCGLILLSLLSFASCTRLPRIGDAVEIRTFMNVPTATKVSYSGKWEGDFERIDWEVGDVILISQEYDGVVREAKYRIASFENNGRRSQAQVEPVDTTLKYFGEGSYIYRGYYPGNEDGHLNDGTYNFSISAVQTNDVRNNLFMIVSNYTVNEQKVKLEFSPVVDAYQFELPKSVSKIQLESLTDNISGDFSVQNGRRSLYGTGRTVEVPTNGGVVRVFTMPQERMSGDLFLRIYHSTGIKVYGLGNSQYPVFGVYHKYNFPEIESVTNTSKVVNGVALALAHSLGYNWQWGHEWEGNNPNDIYWNNPDNNNAWEPIPPEKLWEIIENVEELELEGTWETGNEITADDLNAFPKLKKVKISGFYKNVEVANPNITEIDIMTSEGDGVFNIHDCRSLNKINITNGKSVNVKNNPSLTELNMSSDNLNSVYVDGCGSLKSFTAKSNNNLGKNGGEIIVRDCAVLEDFYLSGPTSGETISITCEDCPELKTFTLSGGDGWGIRYHKEIIRCPKFGNPTMPSGSIEM